MSSFQIQLSRTPAKMKTHLAQFLPKASIGTAIEQVTTYSGTHMIQKSDPNAGEPTGPTKHWFSRKVSKGSL